MLRFLHICSKLLSYIFLSLWVCWVSCTYSVFEHVVKIIFSLFCAVVEVGDVLPSRAHQLRWLGEPVKAVSIATDIFVVNRKGTHTHTRTYIPLHTYVCVLTLCSKWATVYKIYKQISHNSILASVVYQLHTGFPVLPKQHQEFLFRLFKVDTCIPYMCTYEGCW